MCGIFGTTIDISEEQLTGAIDALHHRGPDSNGTLKLPLNDQRTLSLGHTRLAIQDLSAAGHQPMSSQDGRWHVTFNGEIYNHYELRKELTTVFNSSSDTQTLVEYLAAFGIEKTANSLNGIFAFGAYDQQENQFYIVRDPYGIKPVYYTDDAGELSFASEIKPLQQVTGKRLLNQMALPLFLSFRYTPSPETLIEGIQRLAPGHILRYDIRRKSLSTKRYITPTTERFEGSLEDAIDAYQQQLGSAVKRQLLADVPVGVLLSGGIDSALVASFAREQASDLTGYTVGFGSGYSDCEIDDAKETAETLDIKHHHITVNPESLIDNLEDIIRAVEEPLGTTSIMAMWILTQLAKEDVTVALTGQGSDEPWGGYRRYQIEHLIRLCPPLKWPLLRPLSALGRFSSNEAIARGLGCVGLNDTAERFQQAYSLFNESEKAILAPGITDNSLKKVQHWLDWLPKNHAMSGAEPMMRIDTRMNLADDLLLYGDKISMAFALEARVPMLDTELMTFIESLPLEYRSSLKETKIVHKRMAEKYLPAHIVNRKKKGFQVPFNDWSKTIWREYIEAQLLDNNSPLFEVMPKLGVETIWKRHLHGRRDLTKQVFSLLTLSLWSKHFL